MVKKAKKQPLVCFNAQYYTYPTSICRGYWGRYALNIDLTANDLKRRDEWLIDVRKLSETPFSKYVFAKFSKESDYSLFTNILQMHGIFVEKFFHRELRYRVLGEIVADSNELDKLKMLMESAWGYKTTFGRNARDDVFFVVDHIFEQLLFRAINDRGAYDSLADWYRRNSQPCECVICGSSYRLIDLPDWIYAGSNGTKRCCMQCQIVEQPSKDALLPHLRDFVNACGFIPAANASPLDYSFTCRLSQEQWPSVFKAYGKMGGVENVKTHWNTWFKALSSSGVLPNGVMTTSRGIKCLAKDGHECHSLDEQQIDNWLSDHNLPHYKEPIYPAHPVLNPTGKRRSDWLVGEVYIEYFGLTGGKEYDKKTVEKIMLTKQLGLTMLSIYPANMKALDSVLGCLLDSK